MLQIVLSQTAVGDAKCQINYILHTLRRRKILVAFYNLRMHQSKNLIKLVTTDQNRQGQELVTVDVCAMYLFVFSVL